MQNSQTNRWQDSRDSGKQEPNDTLTNKKGEIESKAPHK
jgi:hypothetical protein